MSAPFHFKPIQPAPGSEAEAPPLSSTAATRQEYLAPAPYAFSNMDDAFNQGSTESYNGPVTHTHPYGGSSSLNHTGQSQATVNTNLSLQGEDYAALANNLFAGLDNPNTFEAAIAAYPTIAGPHGANEYVPSSGGAQPSTQIFTGKRLYRDRGVICPGVLSHPSHMLPETAVQPSYSRSGEVWHSFCLQSSDASKCNEAVQMTVTWRRERRREISTIKLAIPSQWTTQPETGQTCLAYVTPDIHCPDDQTEPIRLHNRALPWSVQRVAYSREEPNQFGPWQYIPTEYLAFDNENHIIKELNKATPYALYNIANVAASHENGFQVLHVSSIAPVEDMGSVIWTIQSQSSSATTVPPAPVGRYKVNRNGQIISEDPYYATA
ncbi:uncharacterized protein I303_100422 [Kwoniella dejecticola CBS 10117]|uniref:Uncharacterized protein n=1 Tax=Kwoniella dejecticola CBS 10117 TaxID=1296121 RepID=A0A1A6AEV7_9TREE|nr:uncharacterized protein I303_00422 [Kwoniella dejecticola CBS 10117]OBR88605.1 hypothetical protein I303_00422 [Kwoniella dejecticola CBS 10117]